MKRNMNTCMNEVTVEIDRAFGTGRDYDVARSDEWVGIFEVGPHHHTVRFANSSGFDLGPELRFPKVRHLGDKRIIILDSRTFRGLLNGYIFGRDGTLLTRFFAGDGIKDVVVLGDLFAVTYFDEGVFGDVPPSEQGIAFFDFEGKYLWGYKSLMGSEAVDITDCYCAVRVDHHTLAFSPYTGFELVRLQPRTRKQEVIEMLPMLWGASALSLKEEVAFVFGSYEHQQTIFEWRPGEKPIELGLHSGRLRGLEGGCFLSCGEHGFTIVEIGS